MLIVVPNRCIATSTLVCREAMPLRNQKFCLAFWLNNLASKCKVAMILGKKLRDHNQILSEDLFFTDHHDFKTKIEKSLTDFK